MKTLMPGFRGGSEGLRDRGGTGCAVAAVLGPTEEAVGRVRVFRRIVRRE
jgi:hypothetical protein